MGNSQLISVSTFYVTVPDEVLGVGIKEVSKSVFCLKVPIALVAEIRLLTQCTCLYRMNVQYVCTLNVYAHILTYNTQFSLNNNPTYLSVMISILFYIILKNWS